jgi:hypothetical protein
MAFVAVTIAQPATVLELMSGNADFQVRYRANTLPEWYLNGKVYYILGSLPCSFGENPIWNGTDWICGNFTGFPGGQSTFERLNCLPGQNVAFNGTTYICSSDSDILASLVCPNGNIIVKLGSTFVCGVDSDILAGKTCNQGDILISNGTAFNCAAQTDRDTLRDLNCTEGQTVKYISGKWTCANDLDTFATLTCTAGQVAKFQNGAFVCGSDDDYLANLNDCLVGDTLIGDSQFVFRCIRQPNPPGVPVSFVDGQTIQKSTATTEVDTYFGSPVPRSLNGLILINGLQIFALSFNFATLPRTLDPNFTFEVTIYRRENGQPDVLVATVPYPAGSTSSYVSTSLNLFFNNQQELFIQYRYGNLNSQQLAVTTVLFVRHFVF